MLRGVSQTILSESVIVVRHKGALSMLPTDAAMLHGSMCNIIQNALQKVDVHIDFQEAGEVLSELHKELNVTPRLRRKEKAESGKTIHNIKSVPCNHQSDHVAVVNHYKCEKCGRAWEATED